MTASGTATFFDGRTTARHDATVDVTPAALRVRGADGALLAEWPYDQIEAVAAPDGVLRLGKAGSPVLARLEIRDPKLAHAIDEMSIPVDRSGASERRLRTRVVVWSLLAAVSLVLVAVFGVPQIATRLTPIVPYALERRIGAVVNAQVRAQLDIRSAGAAFDCGTSDPEKPGTAAFAKLVGELEAAAALSLPLTVAAVRRPDANAIALPGGYIYVFQGLIERAETPDELAGVIAHEIGHVANRDEVRSVLGGAGLSLLFGMLLGDFVGGGAVVFAAKSILKKSYSREVEADADAYGVKLMRKIGGDPLALGSILKRIGGASHPGSRLLLDHPETAQRIAAIAAIAGAGPTRPLLSAAEWADLKRVCAGREAP
jgi:Zn-dependent protease with chaperone function